MATLSYDDLLLAFDFVSSGAPGEQRAYLSLETGKTFWISDMDLVEEQVPDDVETSDRYLEIPHKYDLDLGEQLVFRFAAERLPQQRDRIEALFRGRGAYRRFRELLVAANRLEEWYAFEREAIRQALKQWCDANGVRLAEPGPEVAARRGRAASDAERLSVRERLSTVCVFCGSSPGARPAYRDAAEALGRVLAAQGRTLVYGGGNVGLMGVIADAVLASGGRVIGVIPQHLVAREIAHTGVTELRTVASMHERKQLMADLADTFVLLPGGLGSLEEFFEVWTWGQLGLHRKPYGLLNVDGYFDPLLAFLDHAVAERFLRREQRELLLVDHDPERLLARLDAHEPASMPKWIDRRAT